MEATHCAAPDCDKPAKARRHLCSMHTGRMERHGNLAGKQPHAPALERFLAKVDRSGDCWLWTAGVNSNGYGVFWPGPGSTGMGYAHRWSYEHHVGPIGDLHIMHLCDNPPCVNPAHMRLGTAADNAADKVAKGRSKTKTCFAGHAWTPENTSILVNAKGRTVRRCRTCRNNRQRKGPV